MEVICLEDDAFYSILDKVYDYLNAKNNKKQDKWILPDEAMEILGVKTTKLQELRDTGAIAFSQPSKKVILYDRESINEYLEAHKRKTF